MSKFYADEDDLSWKFYGTDNYGTNGDIAIIEKAIIDVSSLAKAGLVESSYIEVTRTFIWKAKDQFEEDHWEIFDAAPIEFDVPSDFDFRGDAQDMIDQLEELYPDEKFRIGGQHKDKIMWHGEPVLTLASIDYDDIDYDKLDVRYGVLLNGFQVDDLYSFDTVLETIGEYLFRS